MRGLIAVACGRSPSPYPSPWKGEGVRSEAEASRKWRLADSRRYTLRSAAPTTPGPA